MILRLCSDTHWHICGPDPVGHDYRNAVFCDQTGSVTLTVSPPESAGRPNGDSQRSDLSAVGMTAYSQMKERFVAYLIGRDQGIGRMGCKDHVIRSADQS